MGKMIRRPPGQDRKLGPTCSLSPPPSLYTDISEISATIWNSEPHPHSHFSPAVKMLPFSTQFRTQHGPSIVPTKLIRTALTPRMPYCVSPLWAPPWESSYMEWHPVLALSPPYGTFVDRNWKWHFVFCRKEYRISIQRVNGTKLKVFELFLPFFSLFHLQTGDWILEI